MRWGTSWILFSIVRRNDGKTNGEFRTKREVLEPFSAIGAGGQTGQPYETPLVLPPAYPRVAQEGWSRTVSKIQSPSCSTSTSIASAQISTEPCSPSRRNSQALNPRCSHSMNSPTASGRVGVQNEEHYKQIHRGPP
jgi:hypothetical protein